MALSPVREGLGGILGKDSPWNISQGRWSQHQAWQKSRSTWTPLSSTGWDFSGFPVQEQGLDLLIPVGPFQVRIFCGSLILLCLGKADITVSSRISTDRQEPGTTDNFLIFYFVFQDKRSILMWWSPVQSPLTFDVLKELPWRISNSCDHWFTES